MCQISRNTAYGLYYKVQQFVLFAAFGLRDAITPIVSFNHGMGSRSRVKDGVKYGLIYTIIIMIVGLAIIEIFAGMNIAYQGIFQALDGGLESLIISVLRQFLFVLPVAWGFSLLACQSSDMMWTVCTTFIIAETLSCVIATIFMKRINRKVISELEG